MLRGDKQKITSALNCGEELQHDDSEARRHLSVKKITANKREREEGRDGSSEPAQFTETETTKA